MFSKPKTDYYKKFRQLNYDYLSILIDDITLDLQEVQNETRIRKKIEFILDRLDFYLLLYSHYTTFNVAGAIMEVKAFLLEYWKSLRHGKAVKQLNDYLTDKLNSMLKHTELQSIELEKDFKNEFITFLYDNITFISPLHVIVKKAKRKNLLTVIDLCDREYAICYPTTRRSAADYYIIPSQQSEVCFPADSLKHRFKANSKKIINKISTKYNEKNVLTNRKFRYKGINIYSLIS